MGRAGKLLGLLGIGNTTTLRLEAVDPECVAGGAFRVRAGVVARRTVEMRSAELTLQRVVRADDYDVSIAPGRRRVAVTETLATQEWLGPGTLEPGPGTEAVLTFAVPPDGPPSGVADRLAVHYLVSGRLHLTGALDVSVRIKVRVLSPRQTYASVEGRRIVPPGAQATEHARLRLDRYDARPGETLTGEVLLAPGLVAPGRIEVVLRRWEQSSYETGKQPAIDKMIDVAPPQLLGAGGQFSLTLPADACPTILLRKSTVRWLVYAKVVPESGAAATTALEINVHTG